MSVFESRASLAQRLSRHLAMGALCVTASANADVQYTAVSWTVPANIDGLYINVESLATGSAGSAVAGWDINPYSATSLTWFNATGTGMMRYPGVITGSAGNLPLGTIVGATGSYGSGAVVVGSAAGNWQLNSTNRFGFRFVAADGLTHYGWGTFEIPATISGATRRITEIAWETTPAAPITVGDTGAGSGPYDPCATTNPTLSVGANSPFVRTTGIADLTTACGTIYKANYYKFTAPATRNYDFSTCAGSGASSLVILDGCAAGSSVVACGSPCGTSGSTVTLSATAGGVYYVVLGSSVSGVDLPSPYAVQVTPWYGPCDTTNPTAIVGLNSPGYNSSTAADLGTSCGTIYEANYYKFTPSASASYTISTCAGGANTRIAVLDGCAGGASILACNDDSCGTSSSLTIDLTGGTQVYVVIGSGSAKTTLVAPVLFSITAPGGACDNPLVASYGDNPISSSLGGGSQVVQSNAANTTVNTIYRTQWFVFTPTATGAFTFKTCNSGDTKMAIASAGCAASGTATLPTIAFNDDALTCPTGAAATTNYGSWIDATNNGSSGTFAGFPLTEDLVAGQTYLVCVGGFGTTTTVSGFLNISGPEGKGNPADLDGDGSVGAADLSLLLAAWGTSGPGDLDGDGAVTAADLGLLLAAWGS
jgi:hypothetical protein